ncbi:ABC transporter permease/M1 family aminopeptidase [Dyella sp.]|jgi:hypothetical protein|uniref:ABC transporter permease/M1 family aminopeptidase n=1 Tax=Dyella sp. TaxID=1869338 RepID=UPI002D7940DF|nr:M1 family aminopeptidase [Dyella sp.]HET6431861.1 M1 family aminopeptidase [Dyella sp.]
MLYEIFRFEWRQQLRSPLLWIVAAVFGAMAFTLTSTDAVALGGATGNVLRNAPIVTVRLMAVLTVFSIFLVALFLAGAALRDFEQRTAELMFTTPVSRSAYLGGRFLAGYLACLAILAVCAAGLLLGSLMPWLEAARLGPARAVGYLWSFAVMVMPSMLFIAGLLFLLATTTRSLLATYVGVVMYFVLQLVSGMLTRDVDNHVLAALLDPFGGRTLAIVTRYWSADELNHLLPPLTGLLLFNRLLWGGVGLALFGAAMALFRVDREGLSLPRRKPRPEPPMLGAARPAMAGVASVTPADGWRVRVAQLRAQWAFDTLAVLRGVPFLIMLILALVNVLAILALSGQIYGTATYPVTHRMLETVRGGFQVMLYIILTFYAGELVWRERSAGVAEVSDAFPTADWVPLVAKLLALFAVVVTFLVVGAAVALGWQLAHGYTALEPGLYLATLALDAVPYLLLSTLAVFVQVLSNNKFLGYLLTIVWLAASLIGFDLLHWDHHLYNFGTAPATPYSDLNGFGHFLPAALWFYGYWSCLAVAMVATAALFWVRGTGQSWRERRREARARFRGAVRVVMVAALLAFASLGGWIFYNTNIVNTYRNSEQASRESADYEKKFARYRTLAQPRITAVDADVDLDPRARRLRIVAHMTLVNRHDTPIRELHVNTDTDFTTTLSFAAHDLVEQDATLGYAIYRLETPLAPGASMPFDATLEYAPEGFANSPQGSFLAHNGTFFNSTVLPRFGYQPDRQLTDRNSRRRQGLPGDVPRMPALGDEAARANTYISNDSDWIHFETTIATADDQIAMAPGYLQKDWHAGGKHYFRYAMDKPMLDFFSWISARYAVQTDRWRDIPIEVYYNPAHRWNVDDMIRSAKDSLAYYEAHFTPYQFRQLRILEFPNYASFAQSFANTIPFSESVGFIADLRDPAKIDYPYYITAHEVAHQWWAHQVIGANMQGSTMLSESLAQYSALMVMKQRYGAQQMRRFLRYELDNYLAARAGEPVQEEPLARVQKSQTYIHYQKASLVFYALQDYIGEDTLDGILRQFLHDKAFQQPPFTTSQEFMDYLKRGTDPKWHALIDDLFWKITFYDNRTTAATARKLPDGTYEVTLAVHAGKAYVDGTGRETAATPDEPVDIGVFGASPGKGLDGPPLYLRKRVLPPGDSTLTVVVDALPAEAGVDPYNKLIDRIPADNRRAVTLP